MAYSKAVEDFAKELLAEACVAQGGLKLTLDTVTPVTRDIYLKLACKLMQNGWSKKQASRDTIDWAAARVYTNGAPITNRDRAFNFLFDLTQAMAEWINDPECGHDYEGLLRMQKETRA